VNLENGTRNAEAILAKVRELLIEEEEKEKRLPYPHFDCVAAMMRRFKLRPDFPEHDCAANRATLATDIAANYAGLSHEQKHFMRAFVSHVSQISYSMGYQAGLARGYKDAKERKAA
jgi:hypothetical protein